MSTITLCTLVVGLTAPSLAQQGPCPQIIAACTSAGFTQGGASTGTGLQVDCVIPIMQGKAQPPAATRPLPQVDPQVVAACKANNPTFGQGKAPKSTAGKAPQTVSTAAPNANAATVATAASAQSPAGKAPPTVSTAAPNANAATGAAAASVQSPAGGAALKWRLIVWTNASQTVLLGLSAATAPQAAALPTPAQVRAEPQAPRLGVVTMRVRAGSPAAQRLSHMGLCAAPGCAIEIDRLGPNEQVVQKYRFSDGTPVVQLNTPPTEEVSFTYGKLNISYMGQGSIDSTSWIATAH